MQSAPEPELSVAWSQPMAGRDRYQVRHFIGVHWDAPHSALQAALVRIWGTGLAAIPEVLAHAHVSDKRLSLPGALESDSARIADAAPPSILSPRAARRFGPASISDAELAELTSDVVSPLIARVGADAATLRAIGLHQLGTWISHGEHDREYDAQCDTSLLSKLTGLTVVDQFPGRDLAYRGRGGPLEAAGIWMFLADRSLLPGRRIRAFLEVDQSARLFLLPPRQVNNLPSQLMALDLCPAYSWMNGALHITGAREMAFADDRGALAVQGRHLPDLATAWREGLQQPASEWSPEGPSPEKLLEIFRRWSQGKTPRVDDLLCTMIQKLAERIVSALKNDLPRSQPVGQLILGGRGQRHALLIHQIQQQLPELEILALDDFSLPTESWQAAAAALLAQLHVDQIPATTSSLTGTESPRILGRVTPGVPSNWHRVLTDMALTLPDKIPLRNAI